jgi:hypothetical protein
LLSPGGLEPTERAGIVDVFGLYCLLGMICGICNIHSSNLFTVSSKSLISLVLNRLYLDKILNSFVLLVSANVIDRLQPHLEYGALFVILSPLSGQRVSVVGNGVYSAWGVVLVYSLMVLVCLM